MSADRYPSRVGREGTIVDRADPVLWGGRDAPGPLGADQLAAYERDGFVVLDGWLDDDTVDECLAATEAAGRDPALAANERLVLEPGSEVVRSLFEVHKVSATFERIVADDRLAGVARQLLDDDVYIHQSRVNLKPAVTGRSFPWHSDFETWHVEDGMPAMRAVSVSIALTDNTAWNGPLLMLPGSHHRYLSFAGHTPEDHYRTSLREQKYGVPDLAALQALQPSGEVAMFTGAPGSVAFFECNLMHGSPDNISLHGRCNAFLVYNACSNRLDPPFGTEAPRPAHVAEREPVPAI